MKVLVAFKGFQLVATMITVSELEWELLSRSELYLIRKKPAKPNGRRKL